MLADQRHVGRSEPGLLLDLPPHRVGSLLARLDATLGKLPAPWDVGALEGEDGAVGPLDHGDDAGAEVSAGHRRAGYGLATEGAEAVAHVDEVGVLGGDALEPAGGLQRVAGAVVQVAEHVPLAQVVRRGLAAAWSAPSPSFAGRR